MLSLTQVPGAPIVSLAQSQTTWIPVVCVGSALAISLVHDPAVLILDEPTTGLDPHLVSQFWKIVETIRKKKKTIIVTSHIFSELEDHCTRVAIMKKGKIAQITKPTNLLKKFEKAL